MLIIGVGFILWALMGTPLSTLQATRYMLAWSLDRLVPRQLGEVNDRFHTPIKAIILCAITGEIALVCLIQVPQASLLGALLAQILAFIVVSIAGAAFPYRLKAIWESGGARRIAGIPAVTLAGIGGVIALGGLMLLFIFDDTINATFAVTRGISLWFMTGVVVLGIVWYVAAWLLNRSKGVDLATSTPADQRAIRRSRSACNSFSLSRAAAARSRSLASTAASLACRASSIRVS